MPMDEKAKAAASAAATSTIVKQGNTSETTKQTQEKSNLGEEKHQQSPLDKAGRFQQFKERGWFDDLDESITKPDFRFNVGGVNCVPSGEITAISGKAGAGKSTALAILIGVLIGQTEFTDGTWDEYHQKKTTRTIDNTNQGNSIKRGKGRGLS